MGRAGQKIVWDFKISTNFCPKIMVFPKELKSPLEIRLRFLTFRPKIIVFSKKRSSPEISLRFFIFSPKIMVFFKKKKSSLKLRPRFYTFRLKIVVFSKKKIFASDQPHVSLISSQKSAVLY